MMIEAVVIPWLGHASIIPGRRMHADKNRQEVCAHPPVANQQFSLHTSYFNLARAPVACHVKSAT